jgi:hypothetical protein
MTYAQVARTARIAYLKPLRAAHREEKVDQRKSNLYVHRGHVFLVRLLRTGPLVINGAEPQALWGALMLLSRWIWARRHDSHPIPENCRRRYESASARAVLLMHFNAPPRS